MARTLRLIVVVLSFISMPLAASQPHFKADHLRKVSSTENASGAGRGGLQPSDRLQAQAGANQLAVVDTVTDGNCGLDAFWKTAQHLQCCRRQPLASLRKLPHAQIVLQLRKLAVDYLRAHQGLELWDGFTLRSLVCATCNDGCFDAYCGRMRRNHQWVDAPILHVLGLACGVDVVIIQEDFITLVGASLHDEANSSEPECLAVCLLNDFHYWATSPLQVAKAWGPAANEKGDWLRPAVEDDQEDDSTEGWELLPESSAASERVASELALCECLAAWDPFSQPSDRLVSALSQLSQWAPGSDLSASLDARQMCLHQLGAECAAHENLPQALRYQRAERAIRLGLSGALVRFKPSHRAQKMKSISHLAHTISMDQITAALAKTCEQGAESHGCLTAFRSNPGVVRNWRILWNSMPKEQQYAALRIVLNRDMYTFMGVRVCQVAFKLLTGIGGSLLQSVRSGNTSVRGMLQIRNQSKPQRYLDVRAWLEQYASVHGEQSPMSGVTLLPAGRKALYYELYCYDRRMDGSLAHLDHKCADISTFLKCWRTECFWVVVAKSQSMFTRCGVCEFLKNMLDSTPREQTQLHAAIRDRLAKHYAFQSAQRLAQSRLEEQRLRSSGSEWWGS